MILRMEWEIESAWRMGMGHGSMHGKWIKMKVVGGARIMSKLTKGDLTTISEVIKINC